MHGSYVEVRRQLERVPSLLLSYGFQTQVIWLGRKVPLPAELSYWFKPSFKVPPA